MKMNTETNYKAIYALQKMCTEIAYMSIIPADAMENYMYLSFPDYGNKKMDEVIDKCRKIIEIAENVKAISNMKDGAVHVG